MKPPSLGAALGLGLRATLREPWLVAVGAIVAAARRLVLWPAFAALSVVLVEAAARAFAARPFDPAAPVEGALAALGSTRLLSLVAGLWLAGLLLGAALRVAWLSGALPTVAATIAGAPPAPRFAEGLAWRFPRVLAAAALGLVADLAGTLFAGTLALAAVIVSIRAAAGGGSAALAAAVALAIVLAIAVPLAVGVVSDGAVARAAVRDERAGVAFASSTRRFLARPGSFLLAAMITGLAAAVAPATVEGMGAVATGFARGVDPIVLLGPNVMIAAAAIAVAAALDVWWLGTVSALVCDETP